MWKKILGLSLVLFFVMAVFPAIALEECTGDKEKDPECWKRRGNELQDLLNQNQGQQQTLTSTIAYLNNKTALTESQIKETEAELKKLEEEITVLSVKISRLDENLDNISKLLVLRIGAAYKRSLFKPIYMVFASGGLSDFFERNKYLQSVQENDRSLLLEMQNSKNQHEEQKKIEEEKQAQAENLKKKLAEQNNALNSQRQEKQRLLEVTKNDEKRYQALLTEAQSQRAAFSRFISSLGGATILGNQTKCDGWDCYYNQRDSQWGNKFIGNSDSSMAEYGCLVTSMAMITSHYGKSLTPGDIAGSSSPFFGSTAYMLQGTWTVNGVTTTRTRLGSSLSNIDDELNAGRPVIVGIYGGPDHFLVIKAKENGEYIMNDPFPEGAANIKFTDKYPLSAISQVDRVTVN